VTDEFANLILDEVRVILAQFDRMDENLTCINKSADSIETHLTQISNLITGVHLANAGCDAHLDRMDKTLDRIERRLGLSNEMA
jgi:archaellum component FlaC